mgnify:CR=1 FL=1
MIPTVKAVYTFNFSLIVVQLSFDRNFSMKLLLSYYDSLLYMMISSLSAHSSNCVVSRVLYLMNLNVVNVRIACVFRPISLLLFSFDELLQYEVSSLLLINFLKSSCTKRSRNHWVFQSSISEFFSMTMEVLLVLMTCGLLLRCHCSGIPPPFPQLSF